MRYEVLHEMIFVTLIIQTHFLKLLTLQLFSEPCEEQSFKAKPIISERMVPELGCLPEQPCIIVRPAKGSQKVKYFK